MFTTLFGKEIREHLLTFRFGAALLTVFVLVIVSVWVLGEDYLHRRDTYNLMVEKSAEADAEVLVPSQISPVLNLPPSPLSEAMPTAPCMSGRRPPPDSPSQTRGMPISTTCSRIFFAFFE